MGWGLCVNFGCVRANRLCKERAVGISLNELQANRILEICSWGPGGALCELSKGAEDFVAKISSRGTLKICAMPVLLMTLPLSKRRGCGYSLKNFLEETFAWSAGFPKEDFQFCNNLICRSLRDASIFPVNL